MFSHEMFVRISAYPGIGSLPKKLILSKRTVQPKTSFVRSFAPLAPGQGMGWPLGSICAQAAHAAVAAVWMYKDHADTVRREEVLGLWQKQIMHVFSSLLKVPVFSLSAEAKNFAQHLTTASFDYTACLKNDITRGCSTFYEPSR